MWVAHQIPANLVRVALRGSRGSPVGDIANGAVDDLYLVFLGRGFVGPKRKDELANIATVFAGSHVTLPLTGRRNIRRIRE